MATVVRSFAIQGIDGYPVDIEVKMLEGQPAISIIGLGDQAVKEAAERIQAAIDESGYVFPKKRVIISLAPRSCDGDWGTLPKWGYRGEKFGRVRIYRGTVIGWKAESLPGNTADDHCRSEERDKEDHCTGS